MNTLIAEPRISLDPENLCRAWIKAAPGDRDAWLSLAAVLREKNLPEEATAALREAADIQVKDLLQDTPPPDTTLPKGNPPPIVTRAPLGGAVYLLTKLLTLPKGLAFDLLARISLSNLDAAAPSQALPTTNSPVRSAVERCAALIDEERYAEAVGLFRGVVDHFLGLFEEGRIDDALSVLNDVQDVLRSVTTWNLKQVLETIAGLGVTFNQKTLPVFADLARLHLYVETDGAFTELVSWFIQQARPPQSLPVLTGALPVESPAALSNVVSALNADGYHVFGGVLADDVLDRLVEFATDAPCMAIHPGNRPYEPTTVDLDRTDVDGFQILSQAVLDQPDVQRLLIDPSFWAVAQEYLGSWPTAIGATMRWSIPSARPNSNALAQMYHWDAGWVRWLNYFAYLTDVDEDSGPHMYVKGTHRRGGKPAELRERFYERIPDADIARFHPAEDIVAITGTRGTFFAGDTRCWHKGLHPTKNKRLTLQLSFANTVLMSSMFFGEKLTIKRSHLPEFRAFVHNKPEAFSSLYYDIEE